MRPKFNKTTRVIIGAAFALTAASIFAPKIKDFIEQAGKCPEKFGGSSVSASECTVRAMENVPIYK